MLVHLGEKLIIVGLFIQIAFFGLFHHCLDHFPSQNHEKPNAALLEPQERSLPEKETGKWSLLPLVHARF